MRIIILLLTLLLLPVNLMAAEPAPLETLVRAYAIVPESHAALVPPQAVAETLQKQGYTPNQGAEILLYADGSFKIRNWIYGESIGLRQFLVYGTYIWDSAKTGLKLTFDNTRQPVTTGFLQKTMGGRRETDVALTGAEILVLENLAPHTNKIALTGYDETGTAYDLGRAAFKTVL